MYAARAACEGDDEKRRSARYPRGKVARGSGGGAGDVKGVRTVGGIPGDPVRVGTKTE
jgi:hypothetical protein